MADNAPLTVEGFIVLLTAGIVLGGVLAGIGINFDTDNIEHKPKERPQGTVRTIVSSWIGVLGLICMAICWLTGSEIWGYLAALGSPFSFCYLMEATCDATGRLRRFFKAQPTTLPPLNTKNMLRAAQKAVSVLTNLLIWVARYTHHQLDKLFN